MSQGVTAAHNEMANSICGGSELQRLTPCCRSRSACCSRSHASCSRRRFSSSRLRRSSSYSRSSASSSRLRRAASSAVKQVTSPKYAYVTSSKHQLFRMNSLLLKISLGGNVSIHTSSSTDLVAVSTRHPGWSPPVPRQQVRRQVSAGFWPRHRTTALPARRLSCCLLCAPRPMGSNDRPAARPLTCPFSALINK